MCASSASSRVPTVFTIGHSTHDPGSFAELLARHEVQVLVDVRRYPGSRRVPWTNAGEIERALPAVEYRHLQDEPQYLVRSEKSGGTAVHKPDALRKRG